MGTPVSNTENQGSCLCDALSLFYLPAATRWGKRCKSPRKPQRAAPSAPSSAPRGFFLRAQLGTRGSAHSSAAGTAQMSLLIVSQAVGISFCSMCYGTYSSSGCKQQAKVNELGPQHKFIVWQSSGAGATAAAVSAFTTSPGRGV